MGLFDLFKRKKLNTNDKSIDEIDFWSRFFCIEKNALPKNSILFYKKRWAGKAEHGVDWIFVEPDSKSYRIVLNSFHSNDYGNPPVESTTNKAINVESEKFKDFDVDKLIVFINQHFRLTISRVDCIDDSTFSNWLNKHLDYSNVSAAIVPGSYKIKETYSQISVSAPKVFADILPNSSDILNIAEIWDGGINEAHLFIQKDNRNFILYEVIFFNNSRSIDKYEYVMKRTDNINNIITELSTFCKIRYAGTMQFDFDVLKNNTAILEFFDLG